MNADPDLYRPIKIFGYVILFLAIINALIHSFIVLDKNSSFYMFKPDSISKGNLYVVSSVIIYFFLTGLGIILKKKWGYYLFKFFLFIFLLAFPLGTFISYKTLLYIKKYNIKSYFGYDVT